MSKNTTRVVVTDFDMPFSRMITFMFKWTLAAIPAAILVLVFGFIASAIVAGIWQSMFNT